LTGGGTSGTVTISHLDTSSASSVNNSGTTFIQDLTIDTYGHVTAIGSATVTVTASVPSGSLMLFQSTSAPTGWTKQTTHNNKALRIVNGTAGTGGSTAFTSALGTPTVTGTISGSTGSHTLATSEMPSHNHSYSARLTNSNGNIDFFPTSNKYTTISTSTPNTGSTGGGGSHNHSLSATFSSGQAAINVQYVDVIIASKD
jgi:hypothetical protein